jgi:DNA-directed RNA polymerase specialized sigma24 family protein
MDANGSVTRWLTPLRNGEADAAQRCWQEYFQRLVGLAHRNLRAAPRGPADSEDVALSAFASFYRGVAGGRFPQLNDRHDLWQVLVMLTVRKSLDAGKREAALKRGGGTDREELTDGVPADGPTPAEVAELMEELEVRLASLGDPQLKWLAVTKMEGFTNAEIAARSGWSVAKVERKLALIRKRWEATPADG